MKTKAPRQTHLTLLLLTMLGLLAACAKQPQTPPPPDIGPDFVPMISVTGRVVPAVWATVSTQSGGLVLEVAVQPGDQIAAGDVLARMDDTDARLAAQQARAALAAAEAQVALLEADPQIEAIGVLEAQLQAMQAGIAQATAQRAQLTGNTPAAQIAAAQAQVAAAQAEQLIAQQQHHETLRCYEIALPDGSTEEVCPLLGTVEEQARAALHATNQGLTAAQAQLNALQSGVGAGERAANATVWAATAQQEIVQAQLAQLRAGATPEQIAVARAVVLQAQAAVDAAEVALERTTVRAPFAGIVGLTHIRMGELTAPGQPVLTLGDLTTLQVEITDLDEIDVARVTLEQPAALTFDAFPERTFSGRVTQIAPMATPGSGSVHYAVTITLEALDSTLRWGMTAFVDIGTE